MPKRDIGPLMRQEGEVADWQMKIIAVEADRLIELAAEDAVLRAELRSLAERILAATADPQIEDDTASASSSSRPAADSTIEGDRLPAPSRRVGAGSPNRSGN